MLQQQARILNIFFMTADAISVILAGYAAYFLRKIISGSNFSMQGEVFIASILLVMIVNNYAMASLYLYGDRRPASFLALLWPVFKAVVVNFAVLSTAIVLFKQVHYSRFFLLLFIGFCFVFTILQRVIAHAYLMRKSKNGFNLHHILIVGSQERAQVVAEVFEKQLSWGHKVVGRLSLVPDPFECPDCIGNVEKLPEILRHNEIDEVVFAFDGDKSIDLSDHLLTCRKMGIQVRILPALWNQGDSNLSVDYCQQVPFLTIKVSNINAEGMFYKRLIDIVGGLAGTIIFLVMFPFIGLLIKLESKGPVIFKQKRVGQHGRVFNLYKFRSMYADAELQKAELIQQNLMNGAMFKIENDPRVSKVGRWLRKYSIDEFPQFVNVLKGEMSLVGTRPPTLDEVSTYVPEHLKRIAAKPGITGLWQVSGRNAIKDFDKVVELDCRYLDTWSFSNDLKILVKTVFVVLKRKGAF
ncbi:MAG: sugar transferase [Desulfobacteraceae bacterium]|nr:sugar transferase [Desulfobacteraceae bacterium]